METFNPSNWPESVYKERSPRGTPAQNSLPPSGAYDMYPDAWAGNESRSGGVFGHMSAECGGLGHPTDYGQEFDTTGPRHEPDRSTVVARVVLSREAELG